MEIPTAQLLSRTCYLMYVMCVLSMNKRLQFFYYNLRRFKPEIHSKLCLWCALMQYSRLVQLIIISNAEQIAVNGLFNLSNTCQAWSWSQELEGSPLSSPTCPTMSITNRFLCGTRGQSVCICICRLPQMCRNNDESLYSGIWVPRFLTGSLACRVKSVTNTKHPNWPPMSTAIKPVALYSRPE